MAYDFTKLGDAPEVDEIQGGDTVLVSRGGEIYRVAGNQIGGAGGYLLEPEVNEVTYDGDNSGLTITKDITDMVAAYQEGSHVVVNVPIEPIGGSQFAGFYYPMSILALADLYLYGEIETPGMYYAATVASELADTIFFTNGNPVPTDASATSLNMLGGTKPVTTEVSNGKS